MPPGGRKKGGGRAIYTYQEKKRVRRDKHSAAVLLKSDKWSLEMTGSSLSAQTASWHTERYTAAGQRCEISMYMWNAADMSSCLKWKCVLKKERHREREERTGAVLHGCLNFLLEKPVGNTEMSLSAGDVSSKNSQSCSLADFQHFFFLTLNAHQPHLAASFNPAPVPLGPLQWGTKSTAGIFRWLMADKGKINSALIQKLRVFGERVGTFIQFDSRFYFSFKANSAVNNALPNSPRSEGR